MAIITTIQPIKIVIKILVILKTKKIKKQKFGKSSFDLNINIFIGLKISKVLNFSFFWFSELQLDYYNFYWPHCCA